MVVTDTTGVTMTDAVTTTHIDNILDTLPDDVTVAASGNARLVMTQTGVFVILPAAVDVNRAADRAHLLATETRDLLASHLSWVPFVDAVVVCSNQSTTDSTAATVVPLDLLADLLREGVGVIDNDLLAKMCSLFAMNGFADWSIALPEDATIDLCNPMIQTIEF